MQFFSANPTIFSKKNLFSPQKVEKKHPRKLFRKTHIHFFFPTALSCQNGPNRRMCRLIDQLYIKLGYNPLLVT